MNLTERAHFYFGFFAHTQAILSVYAILHSNNNNENNNNNFLLLNFYFSFFSLQNTVECIPIHDF